jgi:hypothetical protein
VALAEFKSNRLLGKLVERLADVTPKAVLSFVRDMEDLISTVTPMERVR